jgi:hypothetical protein
MAKIRENGLLLDPKWHESPFAGILLGLHVGHNGAKVSHPIMTINIVNNPSFGETFGIGTKTYMFVAVAPVGDQIFRGATKAITIANIIAKINADSKAGTGCTAYAIGNADLILLIDNVAEDNSASPTFTDSLPNIAEDQFWINDIPDHWLIDTNYFAINPATDTGSISPITLVERKYGGPGSPSYQNFLY